LTQKFGCIKIMWSVLEYMSMKWKMENDNKYCTKKEVQRFHQQYLCKILHITCRDHITNKEILLRTDSRKLADTVAEHRFRITGHVLHLPSHLPSKLAKNTWREPTSHGKKLNTLRWIVPSGGQAAAQCAYWHRRNND